MKKFSLFISALAIFSLVSCVQETQEPVQMDDSEVELVEISFDAGIAGQTKVEVGTPVEGGYKTLWSAGDAIDVFAYSEGSTNDNFYLFNTDLDQAAPSATFSGVAPLADEYYAVYPAEYYTWDPQTRVLSMDANHRHYADGKLDARLFAKAKDGILQFQHITGYIKFTIPEEYDDIIRVRFTAPNSALRSYPLKFDMTLGKVVNTSNPSDVLYLYRSSDAEIIPPGTYYMASLPAEMNSGFSLEFINKNGLVYKKSTDKPAEIVAGQILNLGEIDDIRFEYPLSTVAEVLAGNDGEYFRVQGDVNSIVNYKHGNWYLKDANGDLIYIYGTFDEFANYDWNSLDLIPGDFVTVQGLKYTYNTTVELMDVSVVDVERTLVRPVATSFDGRKVAAEGEVITIDLDVKGENLQWRAHEDLYTVVGAEPMGEYIRVTLNIPANTMGEENTTNIFFTVTGPDDKMYYTYVEFTQADGTVTLTASEIANVADGNSCRLSGYMTDLVNSGHGEFYLRDYTGDAYIYKAFDDLGNQFGDIPEGISEGDILNVVGTKTSDGEKCQLENAKILWWYHVVDAKVEDLLDIDDSSSDYYRLTGVVRNIENDQYGNFDLVDETGSIYVYGLLTGWGGPKKQFQNLGVKEGDTVTLVGNRSSYKGNPQISGAFYVSHTPAEDDVFYGDVEDVEQ